MPKHQFISANMLNQNHVFADGLKGMNLKKCVNT